MVQQLIDTGLQIDIDKCKFEIKRIKYLSLIITPENIEINPKKINIIFEQKLLIKFKDFQHFLKFTNFY